MDDLNVKLIDLVQSEPCIYDKTDVFYSNKDHVKQVWEKISKELQLSVPVCQKRWRYLRDYFVRQLHMTKVDTKRSYWALFERMLFLAPFSTRKTRINTSNIECCSTTTTTTTTALTSNNSIQIVSRKRKQFAGAIIKRGSENDQNNSILSVSSSSSNTGADEFNSFDYLNLYHTQYGYGDNISLLQLPKPGNFQQQLDDRITSLPLEIQLHTPSTELNNNSAIVKTQTDLNPEIISSNLNKLNTSITSDEQVGYNLVSTSTNNTETPINDETVPEHHMRKYPEFIGNFSNASFLPVESHYSNSETSPIPPSDTKDPHHFEHIQQHNKEPMKIRVASESLLKNPENTKKSESKSDSFKFKKRQLHRKRKKSDMIRELFDILKNSENDICDEHDYFFRSLLSSVRKIDEQLLIPFRTEILKTVMKFRDMSTGNQNCDIGNSSNNDSGHQHQNTNLSNFTCDDNDGDDEEVVVIDTGESNWRQKLKKY